MTRYRLLLLSTVTLPLAFSAGSALARDLEHPARMELAQGEPLPLPPEAAPPEAQEEERQRRREEAPAPEEEPRQERAQPPAEQPAEPAPPVPEPSPVPEAQQPAEPAPIPEPSPVPEAPQPPIPEPAPAAPPPPPAEAEPERPRPPVEAPAEPPPERPAPESRDTAPPAEEAAPPERPSAPSQPDASPVPPPSGERPARPSRQESRPDAPREERAPERRGEGQAPALEAPRQQEAAPAESPVEQQLEAEGNREEADTVRSLRERLREQARPRGEGERDGRDGQRPGRQDAERERGSRDDEQASRDRDDRDPRRPDGDVVFDGGDRFIIQFGDQIIVRQDEVYAADRFLPEARDVDVERLRGGYSQTTITRRDGSRIVTVQDPDGNLVSRTRIDARGREVVLIDNRDYYREDRPRRYVRFEDELPPFRLGIPEDEYIVEANRADHRRIRDALLAEPVETVERPYALDEIRYSKRLRDKVRSVELSTITFDFGSAAISPSQFEALAVIGETMADILAESPDQIFLIEGHTDAVGSDEANLLLSDRRAEAIAVALSGNFEIPPENLVTQGYGEQYLKIATSAEERENRRVVVRNITELARAN